MRAGPVPAPSGAALAFRCAPRRMVGVGTKSVPPTDARSALPRGHRTKGVVTECGPVICTRTRASNLRQYLRQPTAERSLGGRPLRFRGATEAGQMSDGKPDRSAVARGSSSVNNGVVAQQPRTCGHLLEASKAGKQRLATCKRLVRVTHQQSPGAAPQLCNSQRRGINCARQQRSFLTLGFFS